MPRYEITSPEGKRFEITAPDGASQDEVLSYAKEQFTPKQTGPSAAERIANDPITKGAQDVLNTSPADLAAANPAVRLGLGGISPVLGAAQFAAEAMGIPNVSDYIKNLEGMKQRGMAAMRGPEDQPGIVSDSPANAIGNAAELTGNVAAFAPLSKIAPAATALGRIGQGAEVGALSGLTAPVSSDNYWSSKGGQVLLGTALGAAIPAGVELGKAVAGGARNILDMLTPEGAKRILTRYQRQIIGEQNVPQVVQALKGAQEIVPLTKPTAAEVLSQVPEGGPIAAHQKITASTPGGVSAQFGQRIQDQSNAIKAAEQYRDQMTKPLRDVALKAANKGGVESQNLVSQIDSILSDPQYATSDVASRALNAAKDKIIEFTNNRGLIDAEALYGIRKNLGETIGQFSKENASVSKKMTAGLERKLQAGIDTEIDKAVTDSGAPAGLWRKYLDEYAMRSKNIDRVVQRQEMMYKPPQRTELAGGADVAGQMNIKGPQLLSRPMQMTNYLLKKMGQSVEKKIDPEAANRYLDPQLLATELEKFTPAAKRAVVQDLIQRGYLPTMGVITSRGAFDIGNQPSRPEQVPTGMQGVRG
jgi:hypothetical protein